MHHHVYLIGFMGSGKSTVGPVLAERLGRAWVDTDRLLIDRLGMSIAEYFSRYGEEAFRREERSLLFALASSALPLVVSTGGGIVIDPDNRRRLRETGLVVHLFAPLSEIRRRIGDDPSRPLWSRQNDRNLVELYRLRHRLYRETAHCALSTVRYAPREAAERIVGALREDVEKRD
ncbi:MAG: shikimate kinase [Hydrogenibacillus sp.]|nr:shikimate kinase [Hydrogenibacillus sp.]